MVSPSAKDIEAFIRQSFMPEQTEPTILIEAVQASCARLRMLAKAGQLRPGASIAGPVQMALADTAAWTLVLHNLGFAFAPSVTSSLNINFLARPRPGDLLAEASLLRLGSKLSVAEVRLFSAEDPELVAHATVAYALHQAKEGRG